MSKAADILIYYNENKRGNAGLEGHNNNNRSLFAVPITKCEHIDSKKMNRFDQQDRGGKFQEFWPLYLGKAHRHCRRETPLPEGSTMF